MACVGSRQWHNGLKMEFTDEENVAFNEWLSRRGGRTDRLDGGVSELCDFCSWFLLCWKTFLIGTQEHEVKRTFLTEISFLVFWTDFWNRNLYLFRSLFFGNFFAFNSPKGHFYLSPFYLFIHFIVGLMYQVQINTRQEYHSSEGRGQVNGYSDQSIVTSRDSKHCEHDRSFQQMNRDFVSRNEQSQMSDLPGYHGQSHNSSFGHGHQASHQPKVSCNTNQSFSFM